MKKKVLLIEDNEDDIKELIGDIHQYFEVHVVRNKFEALNSLKMSSNSFDVVLLDLYWGNPPIPDVGFDILKEIRKLYVPETLPIIIYTARGVEADALKALQEEAQDWLWKNANPAEKVWRLSRAIRNKKIKKAQNIIEKINNYSILGFLVYGIIVTLVSPLLSSEGWPVFSIFFITLWSVAFGLIGYAKIKLKTNIAEIETEIRKEPRVEDK